MNAVRIDKKQHTIGAKAAGNFAGTVANHSA
jgi:hypothetical protein